MMSILLISLFAEPAPALAFRDMDKETTSTYWTWETPDLSVSGPNAREFDAAAATNNTGDRDKDALTAFGYIAKLPKARALTNLTEEVVIGEDQFRISAFQAEGPNLFFRFYKTVKDGLKKVLAGFIEVPKGVNVTEAKQMKSGWLQRFHEMIFGTNPISTDTQTTPYTAVDNFVKADKTKDTFARIKGLVPRYDKKLTDEEQTAVKTSAETATVVQKKLARRVREGEAYMLGLPLVNLQKNDIDVSPLIAKFHEKVWGNGTPENPGILANLDKQKPDTYKAFENDDEPSKLQLDFWQVIWKDTILNMLDNKPATQEKANALVNKSLAELDRLAEVYRTATS